MVVEKVELFDEESGRWLALRHLMAEPRIVTQLVPLPVSALQAASRGPLRPSIRCLFHIVYIILCCLFTLARNTCERHRKLKFYHHRLPTRSDVVRGRAEHIAIIVQPLAPSLSLQPLQLLRA